MKMPETFNCCREMNEIHECRIPGFNLGYAIIYLPRYLSGRISSKVDRTFFSEIRPDTGPDLMSVTPLIKYERSYAF